MGNFAPTVTTGLVLFNIVIFILITAFATDDLAIGQASNVYDADDTSETTFLNRFWVIIWDLPWWLNVFLVFVNLMLIPITIFAWLRGL